jgi:hypothetical protein
VTVTLNKVTVTHGWEVGQMRPKMPLSLQILPSPALSSLKARNIPVFFGRNYLNTLIRLGKLYPQHRHLLQAMGLIPISDGQI